MSANSRYLLCVQMDVSADRDALFQEVYDHEHVPALLQVPGVRSIRRLRRTEPFKIALGGAVIQPEWPNEPRYNTIYEIDSPAVLTSSTWAEAVDKGRWSSAVRPFTRNRRHTFYELIKQVD